MPHHRASQNPDHRALKQLDEIRIIYDMDRMRKNLALLLMLSGLLRSPWTRSA